MVHPVQVPGGDKRVSTSTGDPPDLTLTGLRPACGWGLGTGRDGTLTTRNSHPMSPSESPGEILELWCPDPTSDGVDSLAWVPRCSKFLGRQAENPGDLL